MKKLKQGHAGLTLIELMMILAVLGILIGGIVPSFTDLLERTRSYQITRQLFSTLNYARIEATNYRDDVIVCSPNTKKQCSSKWKDNIVVFVDHNANTRLDPTDTKLRTLSLHLRENETISWLSFGNKPYLRYTPEGTTAFQSGRFYYCSHSQSPRNNVEIIVYRSGRARLPAKKEYKNRCP